MFIPSLTVAEDGFDQIADVPFENAERLLVAARTSSGVPCTWDGSGRLQSRHTAFVGGGGNTRFASFESATMIW
jgi:hypothetical protein